MACSRFINRKGWFYATKGPNAYTGKEVKSNLYESLRDEYSEELADFYYDKVYSEDFRKVFGDFERYPEKYADKLDENGEPKFSSVTYGLNTLDAIKDLMYKNYIVPSVTSTFNLFNLNSDFEKIKNFMDNNFPDVPIEKFGNYIYIGELNYADKHYFAPIEHLTTYKKENLEEAEKWFTDKFGSNIHFETTKKLIDGRHWGTFHDMSVIVSEQAIEGTIFHEAFHVVSQLYLNKKQRQDLYNEYRKRNKDNEGLLDLQVEEILAEEFRDFVLSDGKIEIPKITPVKKNFFQKLWSFIKDIVFGPSYTTEELYNAITASKFNKPIPLSKRASLFVKKRMNKISPLRKEAEITFIHDGETVVATSDEVDSIMQGMDSAFFRNIFLDGDAESYFIKDLKEVDKLYERIMSEVLFNLRDSYSPEKLKSLKKNNGLTDNDIKRVFNIAKSIFNPKDTSNKQILIDIHKQSLKRYGISIELSEVNRDISEENIKFEDGRNNFVESIKFNTKDGAPNVIKMLVASAPKLKRDGSPILNKFGQPVLVEFNNSYDFLANNLAGTVPRWDTFESKLNDLKERRPEYISIINRLNTEGPLKEDLRTKFIQTFSKNKYDYILGLIKENDIIFLDSNSEALKGKIKEKWSATLNAYLPLINGKRTFTLEYLNDIRALLNRSGVKGLTSNEKRNYTIAASEMLGVEFSNPDLINSTITTAGGKNLKVATVLENIVSTLEKNINEGEIYGENIYSTTSPVAGSLNNLIELESNNSIDSVELQHINPEGQPVYGITLNTFLTITKNQLNEISSLESREDRVEMLKKELPHLANSKYATNSLILNRVLEGKPIDIKVLEGYKSDKSGEQGIATDELKEADRYSQLINSTLKGHLPYFRAADRSLENTLYLGGELLVNNEVEALSIFSNYLFDEIYVARELLHKGIGEDILYYGDKLRQFKDENSEWYNNPKVFLSAFRDIVQNEQIFDLILAPDLDLNTAFDDYSVIINDDLLSYFERRYQEEQEAMEALDITYPVGENYFQGISNDIVDEYQSLDEIIKQFVWNTTAAYIEETKIFTGDLSYYKNPADTFKRFSVTNSPKKISRIGIDFDAYLNANYIRKDGKTANRQIIDTIIFEDIKTKSSYLNSLENIFIKSLKKDGFVKEGELSSKGKKKLKKMLEPYENMEEADGQGFISLDEYRDLMLRAGDWTRSHDRIFEKVQNGEDVKASELFYFQPLKTQYSGPLVNKEFIEQGLFVPTVYKHSLLPLLPKMYNNTSMKKLMDKMSENQIGIAQFRSGNKFGVKVDLNTGKTNDFYNADGVINTDITVTQQIDYRYFGIQQDIAPKVKGKVSAGTQMRKLVLDNLFENGIPLNSKNSEFVDKYFELQSNIISSLLNELMEEMSIEISEGRFQITNGDMFVKFLEKAASKRDVSENVLESIRDLNILNEFGESIGVDKIDSLITRDKIESLMLALVDSSVIREKRNGGAKVQVASSGIELSARNSEGGYYTSNELAFYTEEGGKIKSMEVAIPLPKQLLKKYKTTEAANKALEEGELEEYRELLGFRIPTQGKNSIESMRVKKFLPAEAGDIIVMPTEIVAKAGSDYDIDKMTLYTMNFKYKMSEEDRNETIDIINNKLLENGYVTYKKDGTPLGLITKNSYGEEKLNNILIKGDTSISDLEIEEKLIYNIYTQREATKGSVEYFKNDGTVSSMQNELLTLIKQTLSDPDNARELLYPISDYLLVDSESEDTSPMVNDIRTLKNKNKLTESITNVIEARTNMEKFNAFLSGKAGVGQTAVHVTNHVLTQIAGVHIIDPNSFIFLPHNTMEIDGTSYSSLAGIRDISGNWISESLSAFVNAYVDIAKDPYIFELNAGNETANTILYLLRLGVDPNTLARFMAQPVVEEYVKAEAVGRSVFKRALGKEQRENDFFFKALKSVGAKASLSDTIFANNREIALHRKNKEYDLVDLKSKKTSELIDKYSTSIPSKEVMGQMITKYAEKKPLSKEEKSYQVQLLDNFLEYRRQSSLLQKMIRATSPDTKGMGKNLGDLQDLLKQKYEVLNEDGMFGNVDKIFDMTFIGAFQNTLDVYNEAYSNLFYTQHPAVKNTLDRMKDSLSSNMKSSRQRSRARRAVDNEFLRYLLITARRGDKNIGISLEKSYDKMFKGNNSIPSQIHEIQKGKHKSLSELKDNLFINNIIPLLDNDREQFNISIASGKLDVNKENSLVKAFNEVYDISPAFAEELVRFSILQSGIGASPKSFTKIIPHNIYKKITKEIFDGFEEGSILINTKEFEDQFYRANLNLLPRHSKVFNRNAEMWLYPKVNQNSSKASLPYLKDWVIDRENSTKTKKFYKQVLLQRSAKPNSNGMYDYIQIGDKDILDGGIWMKKYKNGENKPSKEGQDKGKELKENCK